VPQKQYPCEQVVPIEQEPRHHLVIDNLLVRAFAVEIAPHDRTLCHHHPHDYLLYVAGDAEIVSAPRDDEWKRLSYRDGDCELSAAGLVHVVENLTDAPFRNVVVELLPVAPIFRRGESPTRMEGVSRIVERLTDWRAAVFTVEMEPKAEVEVCGPAVVASPYCQAIQLEEFRRITASIIDFIDLAWIWPEHKALLRNVSGEAAQVVAFQVGRTTALWPERKIATESTLTHA
jgi:hypothetical protein